MRTPWWESSVGALQALLSGAETVHHVDLLTMTLAGGATSRWTTGDEETITISGTTWSQGPLIVRGAVRLKIGVEVSTMPLTLSGGNAVTISGQPLPAAAARGLLDNARVRLDKVFAAEPLAPWVGAVHVFEGRVSDLEVDRHDVVTTVKSDMELLNTRVPRNVFQTGCLNALYDNACGVSRAAWTEVIAASAASDATRQNFPTASTGDRYVLGWALGLTGANAGVKRTVRDVFLGVVNTIAPWPFPIAAGDTFQFQAGCNKSKATCETRFNNLARFRGQPFVPAPETVV